MRVVWGKAFNVNGSIAMLQGYMGCFDCSTDEAANIPKPVTVVAGFATSLEKWEQWETNWRLVLAEFHAPYFHMKEFFDTRKGAFAEPRWRSEKYRNKFIEALSNVTSDWMLVTVGGLMDHHLFEQASLVCKVSGIFNPFSACGRDCAVRTRDLIRGKYKSDLPIAYVFERGDPGPEMLDRLMLRSELPSPLFKRPRPAENPALEKEDPHLSQLQAADLLAWHMRRASHDGGLNRESFDASIKVFHRIPDRSWKECTKEHMVTLLHSLEAERIPITEFEKFDATVRQVFSVPHSEIVKREKEYQRKRKRIREKRIKTIKVSR
jgi:hypothetical protein